MERLLRFLAVRIRALENELYSLSDGAPARQPAHCEVRFEEDSAFLLLRNSRVRTAKTGDSFRRRALRSSRLFPKKIGDFNVKLVFPHDPRGRSRALRNSVISMGAGLFENLELKVRSVSGGFIVEDAVAPLQLDVIRDQIVRASKHDCVGVTFPELTIGKATADAVASRLGDGTWDCELSIMVVGSRHEAAAPERWFNVATILDGYGTVINSHRKLFRFSDGEGPHEAIELGDTVVVVVLEQVVLTFGICLDFCNLSEEPPYPDLDVDIVVVPSCGGASTMRGHIRRSGDLIRKLKSKSFVVQQHYAERPTSSDPLGYVLARTSSSEPTIEDVTRREPWTLATF